MKRPMTIQEGADHVLAQLTPYQREYASNPHRGQYRGFPALHDLFDANMLLPHAEEFDLEYLPYWNAVEALVTFILCGSVAPCDDVRGKRYDCGDGMCGADDCQRCHPVNFRDEPDPDDEPEHDEAKAWGGIDNGY